jgi:hypothetical protein
MSMPVIRELYEKYNKESTSCGVFARRTLFIMSFGRPTMAVLEAVKREN